MRALVRLVRDFGAERRAMAATEFAIIAPVLLAIMLGGLQLVTYTNAVRRVDLLVRSMSEMLSQATPPSNSSVATVNALDLHFAYDSALVTFPYLMTDAQAKGMLWWQNIQIYFASIKFNTISAACQGMADQSSCNVASVVWTSTGTTGGNFRPCLIPQLPADDASAPTPRTLPRSIFGSPSIIVVDVVFRFQPTFGASFLPSINIARTAYIQPRYATYINYDTANNDGIALKCLGY